jgi:cell division protein FtsN
LKNNARWVQAPLVKVLAGFAALASLTATAVLIVLPNVAGAQAPSAVDPRSASAYVDDKVYIEQIDEARRRLDQRRIQALAEGRATSREPAVTQSLAGSASAAQFVQPLAVATPALASIQFPAPSLQVAIKTAQRTGFEVQVGAFSDRENARRLGRRLEAVGPVRVRAIKRRGAVVYRVRLQASADRAGAQTLLQKVRTMGYNSAWLVVA